MIKEIICIWLRIRGGLMWMKEEEEVTLRLTVSQSVSQSVCLGIEHPCGTCDQILLPVGMLLSEICRLVSVGRQLWREDGSAICIVITQWSESLRTHNHILLSHLRLPQSGGPGSRNLYLPGTWWPSYTPGHWVPFTSSLATRRRVNVVMKLLVPWKAGNLLSNWSFSRPMIRGIIYAYHNFTISVLRLLTYLYSIGVGCQFVIESVHTIPALSEFYSSALLWFHCIERWVIASVVHRINMMSLEHMHH
jgi:hypothetical protein